MILQNTLTPKIRITIKYTITSNNYKIDTNSTYYYLCCTSIITMITVLIFIIIIIPLRYIAEGLLIQTDLSSEYWFTGSYYSLRSLPVSITQVTSGIVILVSAIFVARMTYIIYEKSRCCSKLLKTQKNISPQCIIFFFCVLENMIRQNRLPCNK